MKLVYLAGAMQFAQDGGSAWRKEIAAFLREELGLESFDPRTNEHEILTEEERTQLKRWRHENPQRFAGVLRRIVDHDLDNLIHRTAFVLCLWDEPCGRGAGTAGELTVARLHHIPIYVMTEMPPDELSGWVVGCATEVHSSWESMKRSLRANLAQMNATT